MTPHNRRRHLALYRIWSNPVWQDRRSIMQKIADAVGADERRFQRACGSEWTDAYNRSWDIGAQTYDMLSEPEQPETLTTFRPMRKQEAL
jgi:hypothetical protein